MPSGVYARAESETWPDDRVALLRKLWTEGLSASQCAKKLKGVSRSAVTGKVGRLGLTRHSQHTMTSTMARAIKRARVAKPFTAPVQRHSTRIKPKIAHPERKPNTFDSSPASQAAMALLGKAYKREGLSL